jgi:gluconate 2-dehydrogenase gamma chain
VAAAESKHASHETSLGVRYGFFNLPEQEFIEAAVDRLIPPDANGPSAMEAGVAGYLDKQLAGAWGAGERLYRSGPWQLGTPTQGYQLPLTPSELFRTAIRALNEDVQRRYTKPFSALDGARQDAYLTELQQGKVDLGGVPSGVFFESLLGMTVEGYFCDPVYGGNVDMASWRMIGFPGAYGAYYELVGKPEAFLGEPRSLGQTGTGHVHVDPNIPAQLHFPKNSQVRS